MKLVIASNNKGKIAEYKQMLSPLGYEVMSQSEAGMPRKQAVPLKKTRL